jgi:hypothetical protein
MFMAIIKKHLHLLLREVQTSSLPQTDNKGALLEFLRERKRPTREQYKAWKKWSLKELNEEAVPEIEKQRNDPFLTDKTGQELETELLALFDVCKVKLMDPGGKKWTIWKRIKKSRLNRNDYLKIWKHWHLFLEKVLNTALNRLRVAMNRETVVDVSNLLIPLMNLALHYNPKEHGFISEAQWREDARKYATSFVKRYGEKEVTSYIHEFVYHHGFFMEKYSSLEKFANYSIEGCHRENKKSLALSTNGFGGVGKTPEHSAAVQLLQVHTMIRSNETLQTKKNARKNKGPDRKPKKSRTDEGEQNAVNLLT